MKIMSVIKEKENLGWLPAGRNLRDMPISGGWVVSSQQGCRVARGGSDRPGRDKPTIHANVPTGKEFPLEVPSTILQRSDALATTNLSVIIC